MNKPSIYFHKEVFSAQKPLEKIQFSKYSYPYYNKVRESIAKHLIDYPTLPLRKATINDFLTVHSPQYIRKISLKAQNKPLDVISQSLPELSIECMGLEYCLSGYLYGLGGMLEAIDQMRKGTLERAYCFSMPGHHSHKDWGHGYCLLNPQAAAIKYAQSQGFSKVLVIDWDIHHGDGTQSIFSNDDSVYCISIHHAMDLYMAKISDLKAGTTEVAKNLGHCNIPLLPANFPPYILDLEGMTGEFYTGEESIDIFEQTLSNLPWQPDLIAIFSGYDSHKDDCGGGITDWSNFSFCRLTKIVIDLGIKSDCPILSVHGGGYNLSVTVKAAIAHIHSLIK